MTREVDDEALSDRMMAIAAQNVSGQPAGAFVDRFGKCFEIVSECHEDFLSQGATGTSASAGYAVAHFSL
jgi:hypothetical protein